MIIEMMLCEAPECNKASEVSQRHNGRLTLTLTKKKFPVLLKGFEKWENIYF